MGDRSSGTFRDVYLSVNRRVAGLQVMEQGNGNSGMFATSGGGMEDQAALLQNIEGDAGPACLDISAKTTTR